MDVMAKLRDPDGGCPWDLEQSFQTIAPYTIEEAYEVADAIDRGDMIDLREELGDLLLQSVYHAQMASELAAFNLHDVIHDVTAKMITRHPHVFGELDAQSAADVNVIWDQQKAKEKQAKSDSDSEVVPGALDGVPANFPALLHAQKLTKKAAKVGFEWPDLSMVLDKMHEELDELKEATASGDAAHEREEFGDLLFVLANYARMRGFNAEEALRQANQKFIKRFKGMELSCEKEGLESLSDASLDQMTRMWNSQKK